MTTNATDLPAGSEWVSFRSDDGDTWLFDLTYFRSSWQCIYGQGCAGIEEEQDIAGHRGCCSYGAHFADEDDLQRVMKIAAALPADVWQHHAEAPVDAPAGEWSSWVDALTTVDEEGDRVTKVVDGGCVFLNQPGFERGPGCAIHVAATDTGIDPLEWKPEVCWQLPIRVEHHLDDNDQLTHIVRQWTRADWGESGADLGWWCAEAPEAYSASIPTAETLRGEIAALAGDKIADALIQQCSGTGTVVALPAPTRRAATGKT
ncbi:MAG: hypothetical protein HKN94_07280 [Acidimicrobiales bacterium]|nr:hypothetical protein [Acidimicrobiales bacterium]RZV43477.1 MAG: hypothetical protein EX269_13170 [Acidimicrobiales bacterium]